MPDIFTAQPQKEVEEAPAKEIVHPNPVDPTATQAHHEAPAVRLSSSLPHPSAASAPGLFTDYCPYPKGVLFANQESEEKLILFLRRHFITNVPWIFFSIIFLLLPPIYFAILNAFDFRFFPVPPQMTFVLVAFYYLLVLNYALGKFIVWFYHVGIVTQKRLLDLDVDNILHYHLAETELAEIVDVSYAQKGFFQSFFNFGTVHIQTEAIKVNFEFEQSPKPMQVSDIVTDLRPKKGKQHAA